RATTRQVAGPARGAQPRAAAARGGASRQTAKASSRGNARRETVVAQRPANVTDRGARLASWQAGLPAVSGDQRDCPTGTMSTLARGHDDIVRCMPL
ncbi:MAG: hypothetical protein JWP20_2654, partial [Roseomonas sp.]|nr:hypothetical protein [Roseomonas sp.]